MLSARPHDTHIQPTHHRHLLNPADQAAVNSGSIDVFGGMAKVQDETQGSGGSAMSDLSALENETDDFGRKLIQHQRDAQRLNNIRENPRAFRKARPKPRIAERLEREEKEVEQQASGEYQRGGSNETEPPVTVPREWGRKARRQNDWMRKIREPSITSKEEDEVKPDVDVMYPRKTSYSGDENPLLDWNMVDRPIRSIENTPPSTRRRTQLPTPSSMNHMNTTLRLGDESDDGDFNAASLLASTPATRLPRKIDELTRREIENIERRGLTTRALDHIDEVSPNATRRTSRNNLRDQAIADGMDADVTSPTWRPKTAPAVRPMSPSKIPRRPGSAIGNNKENLPFSESHASYKSTRTTGLSDRTAHAVSTKSTAQEASSRPAHKRNDSMGLLRRLARVSSMSPSPAREKPVSPGKEKNESSRPVSAGEEGALQRTARRVDFATDVEVQRDQAQTEMQQDPSQGGQNPVVTGAWVDSTSQPDGDALTAGAHAHGIRAPATSQGRGKVDKLVDWGSDNLGRAKSEPTKSRSALDDLVYQARHGDNSQHYGENTMASLEDIAHPDMDQTDPTITFDYDALKREQEVVEEDRLLTQDEKDRRQEDLAVEAMNKHLRAARTSIKDANRGLRRVENRIETAQDRKSRIATDASLPTTKTVLVETGKPHVHCTCHTPYNGSAWHTLWTELRSLFYTYDTTTSSPAPSFLTLRPTYLGLALLLYLTWYLSETTLCSYFCHPRFASWVDDYPDPDAPEFPFVIPTLVFRPLRWLWRPVCEVVVGVVGAVGHEVFGEESSTVRPPSVRRSGVPQRVWRTVADAGFGGEWAATATQVGRRVAQSVIDVVDEAGSMWDDERLM